VGREELLRVVKVSGNCARRGLYMYVAPRWRKVLACSRDLMKIALPTNDQVSLSAHFGRSAGFMVFDIEENSIRSSEFRPNGMVHNHALHDHSHHGGGHDHGIFVSTLAGCSTVICGGIGGGAVAALQAGGIRVVLADAPALLDETVQSYLSGTLRTPQKGFCACRH
jgi:predicted Fe-Mo cluster-binding NifX family protein